MRCTKQELQGMLGRLAKTLGKKLRFDYIACYGGYVVVEYCELGGEDHPFGSLRRTAKEMYLSLHMAAMAVESLAVKYDN